MLLFPAVDIIGGAAVRLTHGDYAAMRTYFPDAREAARRFYEEGATHLHMVDLDGARTGSAENFALIADVAKETGLIIEVGGGIRSLQRIEAYLDLGVARVILGTAAVQDPALLKEALKEFGPAITVGVDARDGLVAVSGWQECTDLSGVAFCRALFDMGVKSVVYTDIGRDGALRGANIEIYKTIQKAAPGLDVIASGGVSYTQDITALAALNVYGVIVGKALYEGKLALKELIELTQREGGAQC